MAGRLIANDKVDTYIKFMEDMGATLIRVTPVKNKNESWVDLRIPDLFGLEATLAREQKAKQARKRAAT